MDISQYIAEYARKKKYYGLLCDADTVHNLIKGDGKYALDKQYRYFDSEDIGFAIKDSVCAYTRNKDNAIAIYKHFLSFLKEKNIIIEVQFPPISIANDFERLMFIAKYLQDPRHKISDLEDCLWIGKRTIEEDIKKLRGEHKDSIQICGKVFKIDDMERGRDVVNFPSTAHPLFLTPNLTQVLVTLKGLKTMSEDPLYAEYAKLTASDIWEQLSDYAKTRIYYVLSELMPENLSWYEGLKKQDDEYFYSEYRCSSNGNVVLDCMKNGKSFCVEYNSENGTVLLSNCVFIPGSVQSQSIEVTSNQGQQRLYFDRILKSAYTIEELV